MDKDDLREIAGKQLDRVLGFFPRVDAKASFVFAINTSLLALIALNFGKPDLGVWYLALPCGLAILLITVSLSFIYRCSFPNLKGGEGSLIYFQEIAKRTEAKFISDFEALDDSSFTREVLGQIWRNSEILRIKFSSMKWAFTLTALALFPTFLFLLLATWEHAKVVLK